MHPKHGMLSAKSLGKHGENRVEFDKVSDKVSDKDTNNLSWDRLWSGPFHGVRVITFFR
jgi:hypothetical protein